MARPRVLVEGLDSLTIGSDFEVADMTDLDELVLMTGWSWMS